MSSSQLANDFEVRDEAGKGRTGMSEALRVSVGDGIVGTHKNDRYPSGRRFRAHRLVL
jgi:hypothetical protein